MADFKSLTDEEIFHALRAVAKKLGKDDEDLEEPVEGKSYY